VRLGSWLADCKSHSDTWPTRRGHSDYQGVKLCLFQANFNEPKN
jgi:hypothetical protein